MRNNRKRSKNFTQGVDEIYSIAIPIQILLVVIPAKAGIQTIKIKRILVVSYIFFWIPDLGRG